MRNHRSGSKLQFLRTGCLLAAVLFCLLASCSAGETVLVSATGVVRDIATDYALTEGFLFSSDSSEEGEYLDEDLISTYYGDGEKAPDFGIVEDYGVYIDESDAKVMCEVGLFRLKADADWQAFQGFLKNRIAVRLSNAKSYPDIDKSTLKGARFGHLGPYVYYVVLKGESAAVADRIERTLLGGNG